jgi:hypothetical protein
MTAANMTDLIAKLEGDSARLGNGLVDKSLDEQEAYWRTFEASQRTIGGLNNTADDLNRLLARLANAKSTALPC